MNKTEHRRACIAHVSERFRHAARILCNTNNPVYVASVNGWYDISALPQEMRWSFRMGMGRVRFSELQDLVERMERRIKDRSESASAIV